MSGLQERAFGNSDPTHAVIWLHGLGASSDDFVPVIPYLGLHESLNIRFVFPQAPERPITINGGYVMPGWYDIRRMDITEEEDRDGMDESRNILEGLIADQVDRGIPSEQIVLAGFSQGGAVAYHTGIRFGHRLAGVLALSTYLPFPQQAEAEHAGVNQGMAMLAMHGKADPIVPIEAGKRALTTLTNLGYRVSWREYEMEHNVVAEQLEDIGAWLNQLFLTV